MIAIAAASVHCGLRTGTECTLLACRSRPTIDLHVQRSVEDLAGASIRLCREDSCVEKPSSMSPDVFTKTGWALMLRPPALATLSAERRSSGWSTVRIELPPSGSDYLPDGERYTAEIRERAGALILAFDRGIIYEHSAPNGESCSPRCSGGTLEGYPESGPRAACTGKTCTSGARFEFLVPESIARLMNGHTVARLEVCRNAVCAFSPRDESSRTRTFEGDLAGVTLEAEWVDEQTSRVVLSFVELPMLLAPGDHYSLAFVNEATGSREALFEKTVDSYEERWPNGEACDPHPCRWAEATLTPGSDL